MTDNKKSIASAKPVSFKRWISVKDQLPDLNVNVLMYHEIETTDEGIYPYLEIGYLNAPMEGENFGDIEWMDKEHNSLSAPSHWMRLPKPPVSR